MAAGISGLMSKPPGGVVSARMNSRQRQRHRDTERQADAKTNQSVKNAGWNQVRGRRKEDWLRREIANGGKA
jgi:hypothetical protein